MQFDKVHPDTKIRVCAVTTLPASDEDSDEDPSNNYNRGEESDYFTIRTRHRPEFAMLTPFVSRLHEIAPIIS